MRPTKGRRQRARRRGSPELQRVLAQVEAMLEPLAPDVRKRIVLDVVAKLQAEGVDVTVREVKP